MSIHSSLTVVVFMGMLVSVSDCLADGYSRDEELRYIVGRTIQQAWRDNLRSGEMMGSNSTENDRAPAVIADVSAQSVLCYKEYASRFDAADVNSFEALISKYSDLLETPDWERSVDSAIDARYGVGASSLKGKCKNDSPTTRECQVERSYDVIWAQLYVKLFSCVIEKSQNISKMLKSVRN